MLLLGGREKLDASDAATSDAGDAAAAAAAARAEDEASKDEPNPPVGALPPVGDRGVARGEGVAVCSEAELRIEDAPECARQETECTAFLFAVDILAVSDVDGEVGGVLEGV